MDPGYRSPLVDQFRRGDTPRDMKLLAAQGSLAATAHEQLALLVLGEALAGRGVLCKETHERTLRVAPPLVITREELDRGIDAIAEVIRP